jgi:hypothetical protein
LSLWLRLIISITSALASATAIVVGIAVYDIWRTGHGQTSITANSVIEYEPLGIVLTLGDLILIGLSLLTGIAVWFITAILGRQ